jgi:hypothetical protein
VALVIPGRNGDAGFYKLLADGLASEFTVISCDQRGFRIVDSTAWWTTSTGSGGHKPRVVLRIAVSR